MLRSEKTGKLQAILEVKASRGDKITTRACMQESAEMVAWVIDDEKRDDMSLVGR